jgi:hypothetical protein
MDTATLARLAKEVSREVFVARHSSIFLVIAENPEKLPIGFETAVVDFSKPKGPEPVEFEVLEVVKARGNPYPDRISVGRARNCDMVMRDPSVSKLHAHFRTRVEGGFDLVDLGSANGTRINGRQLTAHELEWVSPGDTIQFGAVLAKLVDADALFDILQDTKVAS